MSKAPEMIKVGAVEVKASDCWRTPDYLFEALDLEFGFHLDAAAREADTHCVSYLGPDHWVPEFRDALAMYNWASAATGPVFVNPPYSPDGGKLINWVERCVITSADVVVVALLPCTPSTEWFQYAWDTANELRLFSRRVNCDTPDGKPSKSARGDLCIFVWRPGYAGYAPDVSYWEPNASEAVRELGATEENLPW